MYLENNSTNSPIGDAVIVAKFINPKDGTLSSYTQTTDANGHVSFNYTPPATIVENTEINITFAVDGGTKVRERNITINFLPVGAVTGVDTSNYNLIAEPTAISVNKEDTGRVLDLYLENNSTTSPISGAVIIAKFINPKDGTLSSYSQTTDANGHVSFNFIPPVIDEQALRSDFNITFAVDGAIRPREANVTVAFLAVGAVTTEVNTTNYNILAIPDTIKITPTDTAKVLDIYVENNSTNLPASDVVVIGHFFNPKYGTLDKYTATTDTTGHIRFNYNVPTTLPSGSIIINFELENASIKREANVTVNFVNTATNSSAYIFTVTPSETNITIGGESRTIEAFINNGINNPVEGEVVYVDFTSDTQGRMNGFSATTDANGRVAFLYTSPDNITALYGSDINITLRMESNSSKEGNATIHFRDEILDYTLMPTPTEITIDAVDVPKVFDLYLVDTVSNRVIPNKVIKVKTFDITKGTFDNYQATTDSNGHVVFNYTSPSILPSASDFNVTFIVDTITPIGDNNITIHFATPIAGNYSDYNLTVLSNEINITSTGQSVTIKASLANGIVAGTGEVILVQFFDGTKGIMNKFSGTTDTNGKVEFIYTSPDNLTDLNGSQIRLYMENNSSQDVNITLNVDSAEYNITSEENLTIPTPATEYTISVGLSIKDTGGGYAPAIGKTIVAEYLMPIYGELASYEGVVGANGNVVFTYTSPSSLQNIADTNITFYYKENRTIISKTTLRFNGQTSNSPTKMFILPSSLTITAAGEEQNVTIVTVNAQNIGVSTTIGIEEPINGVEDYGYFSSNVVTTDANGRAVVRYTAPNSISGLVERNITITETSQNILTQELNIKYLNAGTSSTYDISVINKDSYFLDTLDQFTVVIHSFGSIDNKITDTDVLEVNLTTIFPVMLNFNTNNTTTYSGQSSNPITIRTQTVSGTAAIEISALIFDGSKNVVLTKTIPIVILSGPVQSLSLFYKGTGTDATFGIYQNFYTIHAVDKYNNPAREGTTLYPSVINGVKLNKASAEKGQILAGSPATFKDDTNPFNGINTDDLLAIIPKSTMHDNLYLGGWSISNASSSTLTLDEEYQGVTTPSLSFLPGLNYLVGNSDRYVDGYGIATVDIQAENGSYKTDANGNVGFEVRFDPILAGHTVTLSAHAYDINRTGVAKVAQLRWDTFNSSSKLITNDGTNAFFSLALSISNGLEHLVGVSIDPDSIKSSDSGCDLNISLPNILTTDINGRIYVGISTGLGNSTADECTITWDALGGNIYKEY